MENLNKEQLKEENKRDKTMLISLFCFVIAIIFVGIITSVILGIVNNDLDRMNNENEQIIEELDELDNLFP